MVWDERLTPEDQMKVDQYSREIEHHQKEIVRLERLRSSIIENTVPRLIISEEELIRLRRRMNEL